MLTEIEAVRRVKENDISGLRALVELHQHESIRLVVLIVRDRQLAEDIVSDSFLTVFERIKQFDENRQFFPWFRRILINNALKRINRRKQFLPLAILLERDSSEKIDLSALALLSDPSEVVEESEMKVVVREAINSLSPKQRTVIVLRYYFGLSESEVAEALGIPRGTVKSRTSASIGRLAGLLSGLRSLLILLKG